MCAQSMECRFRYASKFSDTIFSTAKTAPHRHRQQLRAEDSARWYSIKLPNASCVSSIERPFKYPTSHAGHNDLCYSYRYLRYTYDVARGGSQLVPGWSEASMGSWASSDGRAVHVQKGAMISATLG